MRYSYSFVVWPAEGWEYTKALFTWFGLMSSRCEIVLTEEAFEKFRSDLGHDGFTLREIDRWPFVEPETIL